MGEFSKPGQILRGGIPLAYISEVQQQFESDDKEVKTLLLGLAGFSDGAQMVSYSLKGVIPQSGFEYDMAQVCVTHQTQDLGFKIAGVLTNARGRFKSVSISTSVDAPNAIDAQFVGFIVSRAAA